MDESRKQREERLVRLFDAAATGLNLVYEAAADGHDGAAQVLADLADKLTVRGGDWQQMKYLRGEK